MLTLKQFIVHFVDRTKGQAVMFVTKIPRTLRLFSLDLDVIAYTNKMKRAQREGRDVLNVEKLAILLLFAVL